MTNVAFIGTGLLGSGMVERMLGQGDRVTVWNRTQSKAHALEKVGATVAPTAADAVRGAARVHLALPDDTVVDAVMASIRPHLLADAIVVDHSTTAPAGTAARLARMAQDGVGFLHAPVFMSPQMCRDGVGLMMVSGPARLVDAARPALARMTGEVWYVGERPDLAASYKLFGNAMILTIVAGLADVMAMATGVGIDLKDAVALFSKFQPGVAIPMRSEKMARGDFSAMFEMVMARKDVRLMMEAAAGRPLTVLPAIAIRMDEAIADGHGRDDVVALAARVVPAMK